MEIWRNVTDLKLFIGLCNVYRLFVPTFAGKAAPLNAKLRKVELMSFHTLMQDGDDAIPTLQNKLKLAHVLALPRANILCTVSMNAFEKQRG